LSLPRCSKPLSRRAKEHDAGRDPPTDNASEARVLTWQQADLLYPYDVFKRWRKHEPAALHADEPEYNLEELAVTTVAAEWLTRWQPIAMHRAILAGATSGQLSEAVGLSIRDVLERWQRKSARCVPGWQPPRLPSISCR